MNRNVLGESRKEERIDCQRRDLGKTKNEKQK